MATAPQGAPKVHMRTEHASIARRANTTMQAEKQFAKIVAQASPVQQVPQPQVSVQQPVPHQLPPAALVLVVLLPPAALVLVVLVVVLSLAALVLVVLVALL